MINFLKDIKNNWVDLSLHVFLGIGVWWITDSYSAIYLFLYAREWGQKRNWLLRYDRGVGKISIHAHTEWLLSGTIAALIMKGFGL